MLLLLFSPSFCFLLLCFAAFCALLKLDTTSKSTATCHKFTARSSSVTSAQVIPSDISRQTERRRHPIKVESEKSTNKKKMQQNSCPKTKENSITELGLKVKRGSCTINDGERGGKKYGQGIGDLFNLLTFMKFRLATWNLCATEILVASISLCLASQITSLWSREEKVSSNAP